MEGKKILVVDDDTNITELLYDFCSETGYDVKVVNRSPAALATALEFKPDLITLDLEMPEMDGLEVLKALKSHEKTRAIPVLVISSLVHQAAISPEAVQGLFEKPIKFANLLKQINQVLKAASA
jgi:CheY-like chemotaxis protein